MWGGVRVDPYGSRGRRRCGRCHRRSPPPSSPVDGTSRSREGLRRRSGIRATWSCGFRRPVCSHRAPRPPRRPPSWTALPRPQPPLTLQVPLWQTAPRSTSTRPEPGAVSAPQMADGGVRPDRLAGPRSAHSAGLIRKARAPTPTGRCSTSTSAGRSPPPCTPTARPPATSRRRPEPAPSSWTSAWHPNTPTRRSSTTPRRPTGGCSRRATSRGTSAARATRSAAPSR